MVIVYVDTRGKPLTWLADEGVTAGKTLWRLSYDSQSPGCLSWTTWVRTGVAGRVEACARRLPNG